MISKIITVVGKVQGVWFRASAKQLAEKLSLKGTVQNIDADKVLIKIHGNEKQIATFCKWCATGPKNALVKKIEIDDADFSLFETFEIIRKK